MIYLPNGEKAVFELSKNEISLEEFFLKRDYKFLNTIHFNNSIFNSIVKMLRRQLGIVK